MQRFLPICLAVPWIGALGAQQPASAPAPAAEIAAASQPAATAELPAAIVPRAWLVIAPVDARGRRPFRPDAVFAKHLLDADAPPPVEGEALSGELGSEQRWRAVEADEKGAIPGEFGYAFTSIDSPADAVYMAKLSGALSLYVNGAGFTGDVYAYGFGGVPIALRKGSNRIYVTGLRGQASLVLSLPARAVCLEAGDLLYGYAPQSPVAYRASKPRRPSSELTLTQTIHNASRTTLSDVELWLTAKRKPVASDSADDGDGALLGPLCVGRPNYTVFAPRESWAEILASEGEIREPAEVEVRMRGDASAARSDVEVSLPAVGAQTPLRWIFRSMIDRSLQSYYSVEPPEGPRYAKILVSLHGAGVDALGQARSYSVHDGWVILCPLNRRPYGFDWQDWGRIDAYEAMENWSGGRRDLPRWTDNAPPGAERMKENWQPLRVFLTGHSMGGHGTWHLAANDPGRFYAIAPSAGWCSFDTYGSRPEGKLRDLWRTCDGSSRTEDLIANLVDLPTYILHGTADDNVPVGEAREMEQRLRAAGGTPTAHYQEGAGHWWDGDASAGADCLDWPGIWDLFNSIDTKAPVPNSIHIRGADPGIDGRHFWLRIEQSTVYGQPFEARGEYRDKEGELTLGTQNIRLMSVRGLKVLRATIDGQTIEVPSADLDPWFVREGSAWRLADASAASTDQRLFDGSEKSPDRCGPFKRAFASWFSMVYPTLVPEPERAQWFERARSDHLQWWYRANGTPLLLSDEAFLASFNARPRAELDRLLEHGRGVPFGWMEAFQPGTRLQSPNSNVILYGNADTNEAWKKLVPADFPIEVHRGWIRVGDRRYEGEDLACVFVAPRADDKFKHALVGAFGDTGLRGLRLGYTLQPFTSGVGYPDYAVFSSEVLAKGDEGVLEAGWFDHEWKLQAQGSFRRAAASSRPAEQR